MQDSPFFLDKGRAMVSLGPITLKRHCPLKCPFCYVESVSFVKYAGWAAADTVKWLVENESAIDVIYISGDTDSFAQPRTDEGLELLERISFLGKDVLFTTRYVFERPSHLELLGKIARRITDKGGLALACGSICQISQQHFEPRPIKSPEIRIKQLNTFRELGWLPVLAMRPIIPDVPVTDFMTILELASTYTSLCLIAPYFYDPSSPMLKPGKEGQYVGGLYFDIGTSSNWYQVDPDPEVLAKILETANAFNMRVFESSSLLYSSLKS